MANSAGVNIVLFGVDEKSLCADEPDETKDRLDRRIGRVHSGTNTVGFPSKQRSFRVCYSGGLFAGHRMPAHEIYVFGEGLPGPAHHVGLGARRVCHDRSLNEVGRDLLHYFAHSEHGNSNDYHARAADRSWQVMLGVIDGPGLLGASRATPVTVVPYDFEARQPRGLEGHPERPAD